MAADEAWYITAFGDLYPVLYPHRDDRSADAEVGALVPALGLAQGDRVLDAACGTGRHLAALLARGLDAYGADLSPALLGRAARRPLPPGRLLRADLRRLPFGPVFDAVLNLFTSLGYFETDAENERALRSLARLVRPGGALVVDHLLPERLAAGLVPESLEERDGWTLRSRRSIAGGRVVKEVEVRRDGRTPRRLRESVRLYAPGELADLMRRAGLADVELWGSYEGEPLEASEGRLLAVGRRRDG